MVSLCPVSFMPGFIYAGPPAAATLQQDRGAAGNGQRSREDCLCRCSAGCFPAFWPPASWGAFSPAAASTTSRPRTGGGRRPERGWNTRTVREGGGGGQKG